MNKDNLTDRKEIGFESIKFHSKIYKVMGYKRSVKTTDQKKTKIIDKNFIEAQELHLAADRIFITYPLRSYVMEGIDPITLDVLKLIDAALDQPWEEEMLNLLPRWYIHPKKKRWEIRMLTSLSATEVQGIRYIEDGKMVSYVHNRRIGKHYVDEIHDYPKVKTLREFILKYNKELSLQLHHIKP